MDETLSTERLIAALSAAFGILATVLAALGLYGVISYAVGQRVHEIGVRMALGASRVNVLTDVVRQAMTLTMSGLVLGLLGALAPDGALWTTVLARLQQQMTAANYRTWPADTRPLGRRGATLIVGAPSSFVREWLQTRFRLLVRRALQDAAPDLEDVAFEVAAPPAPPSPPR